MEEGGWAPGPVWTGAENLASTGIRSPDRPARSEPLYDWAIAAPNTSWRAIYITSHMPLECTVPVLWILKNFLPRLRIYCHVKFDIAGTGDHAIYRVVVRPFYCWDRGFEFLWGHGCSSLVFVVCCVGSGLCDGLITRSEESYRVCVCLIVCDLETSTTRRPGPELGCCVTENSGVYTPVSDIKFSVLL